MSLLTYVNRLAGESIKSCEEDLKKMTTEEFGTSKERMDRLNANIDSAHRGVAEVKTTLTREKLIAFIKSGKVPPELVFGERGEVSAACVRVCNRYSVAFSRNTKECCVIENSNNDRLFSTKPSDFVFVEDTYPLVKMDGDEAVFLTGVCLSKKERTDQEGEDGEEGSDVSNIIIDATNYAKVNTDDIFGMSKEDNADDDSNDEDECSGRVASKGVLRVFNGGDDSPAFSLSKLQVDDLKYGWGNKDSMSTRDSAMGFSSTCSTTKQVNDLRCFSHMFEVEVLGDTGNISIVLENGPDLYNSEPVNFSDQRAADESNSGFCEVAETISSNAAAIGSAEYVDTDDDVMSSSSTTYTYSPTRKHETTRPPPLPFPFSCEESVAKMVSNSSGEVISLFNALNDITSSAADALKIRRGLLVYEYEDTPSSSVPTLYNPILIGAKEFLENEKGRQSLNANISIQNVLFRVFSPCTPKLGDENISQSKMDSMMKQIRQVLNSEDVDIATSLLKDEVEATRISHAIAREIMSSVAVIGNRGANHSICVQQERVEGMRGAHDIGIHSLIKNAANDSLVIMTEYVTKWMKAVFKPVLHANDVKIIRTQYSKTNSSPNPKKNENNKRSRKSEEDGRRDQTVKTNKRVKLESAPQEHYIEKSTDAENISVADVTAVTVLPPSLVSEPKEAVSDAVLSECLHDYAQDVAHAILSFSSPKRELTLASLTRVVPIIKKKMSDIMGKQVAYTCKHIVRPVEMFSPPNPIRIGKVQANKMRHLFVDQSNVSYCGTEENSSHIYHYIKSKLANVISNSTSFNHNIAVSDNEEYISKNLYGALNVRRLAEENAAFIHLSDIMILENICRILSGRSVRYSPTMQNAFKWYLTVLIRNRICDNIPRFIKTYSTMYGSIASDQMNIILLSNQIYAAIKWLIDFEIPHQIIVNRFIHPETLEFDGACSKHDIFKPGVRQAAIIPQEYFGSWSHPIEMTTLCPGSSIPRALRIDGKHADTLLCVNNYDSGNLLMISMSRIKTLKECESILSLAEESTKNKKTMSMTSLFPNSVIKASSSKTLALVTGGGEGYCFGKNRKEIKRHSTDNYYHLFRNTRKVQYKPKEFIDENEAIPLIMYCSFDNWRSLPLFGVNCSGFEFKLDIPKSSKMMLSVAERVWRNGALDGLLYKNYVDSVDRFFVKKPAVVYDSISDFDIVVYNCKVAERNEESQPLELARCHFVNESFSEEMDSVIFLPRYRATAVKNSSAVRKVVNENSKKFLQDGESGKNCTIKYSSASAAYLLSPVCTSSLHHYTLKIQKILRSNEKQKLKYMKRRRN